MPGDVTSRGDRVLDRWFPIGLSVAWVAAVLIVNPSGNFPITDDWSYGYAVRALVTQHRWSLTDWTSVPLATQILWGALFCLPAGFSFNALRISTLVLAWAAGIGTYRLLRLAGATPTISLIGAFGLLFCPLFFGLAFTFMTDVPFLALVIWASVFTVRSIGRDGSHDWVWAMIAFTAATLLRQVGAALAIAAAVAIAVSGIERRRAAATSALVAAVPAAALMLYNAFLNHRGAPALYHLRDQELLSVVTNPLGLLRLVEIRSLQSYVYIGLFAIPVAWLTRVSSGRLLRTVLIAVPAALLMLRGHWLPLDGGVLYNIGLNPTFIARPDMWPKASSALWIALTLAGIAAAGTLAAEVVSTARRSWGAASTRVRAVMVFCALGTLAYVVPSSVLSNFFDRYLLVPLVLVFAVAASLGLWRYDANRRVWLSFAALALVAAFDIAAVHDFLSYDRARWAAVADLLAAGVPAERIEGGYDVNGWIAYHPDMPLARSARWWDWSVDTPAARLSFGPVDGYQTSAVYPFNRWIGTGPGVVDVLIPVGR